MKKKNFFSLKKSEHFEKKEKKSAKRSKLFEFCQLRILVFDQSSPVQPISGGVP